MTLGDGEQFFAQHVTPMEKLMAGHLESPTIKSTMYSQALSNSQYFNPLSQLQTLQAQNWHPSSGTGVSPVDWHVPPVDWQTGPSRDSRAHDLLKQRLEESLKLEEEKQKVQIDTRLVKVFIVDPTDSLDVKDRLIYKSDEILTDKTDQELYFDCDIKEMLAKHNEKRIQTEDKKRTGQRLDGKTYYLEPARVRDLKMQVVVLAQF